MSQSTQLQELLTSLESELIRLGYTDGISIGADGRSF